MTGRWSRFAAIALTAILVVYLVAVGRSALALTATGEPQAVGLGVAVLVLPLMGAWLVFREWRLAVEVQQMADQLADEGRLPVDDLPRTPGGRIVRGAADEAFGAARQRVEDGPEDWAAWFHLAFAYDAARDRRRARAALRTAARLWRSGGSDGEAASSGE